MIFEEVKTFLEIVESGSIGKAASKLYISQGSASTRLQHLERELGIMLLFRQPGIRQMKLTPEGEYFLSIARQWISLQQQAENIHNLNIRRELRIASNDSNNRSLLANIYPYFTETHPEINLYLQTEHSTEIHQLIEQQAIDIGFVNSLHQFSNVIATPLWKESMVLLCHKDNPFVGSHDYKDLQMAHEVYTTFSYEFDIWHQRTFHSTTHKVAIGVLSLLPNFLIYPNTWTITTHSAADALALQHHDLLIIPFQENSPPTVTTYLLNYRYSKPWIQDLTPIFMEEVLKVAQNMPELEILYTLP